MYAAATSGAPISRSWRTSGRAVRGMRIARRTPATHRPATRPARRPPRPSADRPRPGADPGRGASRRRAPTPARWTGRPTARGAAWMSDLGSLEVDDDLAGLHEAQLLASGA